MRKLAMLVLALALTLPATATAHGTHTNGQRLDRAEAQFIKSDLGRLQARSAHYRGCANYFAYEPYHTTRVWTVHCHDQYENQTRMHILGISSCMHAITARHEHRASGAIDYYYFDHAHGVCGWTPSTFP